MCPPPTLIAHPIHCRLDYMHLVFSALPQYHGSFRTLPPCILKPERLWSGKQIVSTLLLNVVPQGKERLNLVSKAKIAVKVSTIWSMFDIRQQPGLGTFPCQF